MTTVQPDTCSFCEKRGLPLLLVRHAVAPSMSGAPKAAAPLQPAPNSAPGKNPASASAPIELEGAAYYTTRLLRVGYVYVYDEKRAQWECYYVTENGYFFKFSKPDVPQKVPAKFTCTRAGHPEVAGCITIADPGKATKVWVSFSDVRWTAAVTKAHADPAFRRRHMVEIDVQAALGGGDMGVHARPIAQVSAVVAEYAMDKTKANDAFDWTPFHVDARHGLAERLVQSCDTMRKEKGLIVTLADPAGIVIELAILMKRNAELFTEGNALRKRNLAASTTISQIEKAVREQAVHMEELARKELNSRAMESPTFGMVAMQNKQYEDNLKAVKAAEAQRAGNTAWVKYAKKYNQPARHAWEMEFKLKFNDFDKKYIAPLAIKHAAWMQSESIGNYFACNFDRTDPASGVAYTKLVNRCVIATQDKSACYDLYVKWLGGSLTDPKNLLLQAMMFNQKSINDEVEAAVKEKYKWEDIPWDHLIEVASIPLDKLRKATAEAFMGFVANFAGPLTFMLSRFIDSKTFFRGPLMLWGAVAKHPIIRIEFTGTREEFRSFMGKNLRLASGLDALTDVEMNNAVDAEMARLRIDGELRPGNTERTWLLMRSSTLPILGMPDGLSYQEQANWIARQNMFNVKSLDDLNLHRWQRVVDFDVRMGAIGGLLQAASMYKLFGDQKKALTNEKFDASARLSLGLISLSATVAEVVGSFMFNKEALKMSTSVGVTKGTYLKWGGRHLGILAGMVMAGFDLRKANEAEREEQSGMYWLYSLSALFGFALSGALFFAGAMGMIAIPVIGALILIVIAISVAIEYHKDDPLQDWLERCPWGILPAERYPDFETMHAELTKAIQKD